MIVALITLWASHSALAFDLIPARRPNPTRFESGWLVFPVYAHIPGIGSTYGAGFLVNNIDNTRTSLTGLGSFGDTQTAILSLNEVHIIKDQLIFNLDGFTNAIPYQGFSRGTLGDVNSYYYQMNKEYGVSSQIEFHFFNRHLIFSGESSASQLKYAFVTGSDGTRYNNADNGSHASIGTTFTAMIDLSDEVDDPRRGLQVKLVRDATDVFDHLHSRFYTLNYFATAYIPIHNASTWAFNAYRGQAFVWNRNTMSETQLQTAMSFNCSNLTDPGALSECQTLEKQRATSRFNENQQGTAGILGGPNQLRGYPYGRFEGSQSLFYGSELRLNLTDGNTQFDWGFVRGALSIIQLAPFYEIGTVSDRPGAVETGAYRTTYGIGARVGFSGALVRADVGFSQEGSQFTLFVGYPWDLPPF